jgi:aromatic-L-amino-acid decarboxylase
MTDTTVSAKDALGRAAEHAGGWLDTLHTRPVQAKATYEEMLAVLGGPVPDHGADPLAVVDDLAADLTPGLTATGSGRFFGFVIGGSVPAALGADVLVSAWDQNTGLNHVTPGVAAAEHVAGTWLLDLLGLPAGSSVGFVTGGCMANATALMVGRHAVLDRAGWDVEAHGLQGAPQIHVVTPDERHATIDLALRYVGLGTATARHVATDGQGRVLLDDLAAALAEGAGRPTLVTLAAGNINTGAFDPFVEAVELAHRYGAWVHVDGAFGLWAGAAPGRRSLVEGVAAADSWATDAHKWLNVPYDCGVAISRDPAAHRAALGIQASYLIQSEGPADPNDLVPEFSRRARGVPVYAALRELGRSGVADVVERCCSAARRFADGLARVDGVGIVNDVVLNQVLVRFDDDDAVTRAVGPLVQADGRVFLSGTTFKGRAALRVSVSNWHTDDDDVDLGVAAVSEALVAARQGAAVRG